MRSVGLRRLLCIIFAVVLACLPCVCFADQTDSASDDLYQFTLGNSLSGLGLNPYYCIFDGVLNSSGGTDSGTHQNTYYYNFPFTEDIELATFDVDFEREYSNGHLYIDGSLSYYVHYVDGSYYFSYIPDLTSSSTGTISAASSSTFDTQGYYYQFYTVFPSAVKDDPISLDVYLDITAVGFYYSTPKSCSVCLNFYDSDFNLVFRWSSSGGTSTTSWSAYDYSLTDLAYSGWTSFDLSNYDTAAFDNVSYVGVMWKLYSTSTSGAKEIIYVSDSGISYDLMSLNSVALTYSNYTVADAADDGYISSDDESCWCNCNYWLEQILAQTVTVNDNLNTIISKIGSSSVSSESSSALSDSVSSLDSASGDYTTSESKLLSYGDSVDSVDMDVGSSISEFSNAVGFWTLLFAQWTLAAGSLWQVFAIGLVLAFVFYILRINPHS